MQVFRWFDHDSRVRTNCCNIKMCGWASGSSAMSIAVTGCSQVASALNIVNPRYSLQNLRPRVNIAIPPSASTIDLDFDLGVDNPNSVGIRLDRVDFDVLVNDNHLLNSTSTQRVEIPARGFGAVHLTSRIGYQEIRGIFQQVVDLVQGNRARYTMNGTAYYNTPIGTLQFPVTVNTSR